MLGAGLGLGYSSRFLSTCEPWHVSSLGSDALDALFIILKGIFLLIVTLKVSTLPKSPQGSDVLHGGFKVALVKNILSLLPTFT